MTEKAKAPEPSPVQELQAWLAERGYVVAIVAVGPRGSQTPIEEFVPERWGVQLIVGKRE